MAPLRSDIVQWGLNTAAHTNIVRLYWDLVSFLKTKQHVDFIQSQCSIFGVVIFLILDLSSSSFCLLWIQLISALYSSPQQTATTLCRLFKGQKVLQGWVCSYQTHLCSKCAWQSLHNRIWDTSNSLSFHCKCLSLGDSKASTKSWICWWNHMVTRVFCFFQGLHGDSAQTRAENPLVVRPRRERRRRRRMTGCHL